MHREGGMRERCVGVAEWRTRGGRRVVWMCAPWAWRRSARSVGEDVRGGGVDVRGVGVEEGRANCGRVPAGTRSARGEDAVGEAGLLVRGHVAGPRTAFPFPTIQGGGMRERRGCGGVAQVAHEVADGVWCG